MTNGENEISGEVKKLLEEWKKDSNYLSKIAKELVFNSDRPLEERYMGVMILMDDITARESRLARGKRRFQSYLNTLFDLAMKRYKEKRILEFTEKWSGKDVCEEMAEEMRRIEKPNHCYSFHGITVVEIDCNLCKSRKCERGGEDYVPNKFEELLSENNHIEPSIPDEQETEVDDGTDRA